VLNQANPETMGRVTALVHQVAAPTLGARSLAADDPLTDRGLTSVDMVNLMLAVEAEFDIMIPAPEITPENFRSIATIEALVAKLSH
jgi:acyl carrier protein